MVCMVFSDSQCHKCIQCYVMHYITIQTIPLSSKRLQSTLRNGIVFDDLEIFIYKIFPYWQRQKLYVIALFNVHFKIAMDIICWPKKCIDEGSTSLLLNLPFNQSENPCPYVLVRNLYKWHQIETTQNPPNCRVADKDIRYNSRQESMLRW